VEWYRQGKFLIRPLELSGKPTSSHLVGKQEELGERNNESGLTKYLGHTSKGFLTCRKILRHEVDSFTTPPREVELLIIAFKNLSPPAGIQPAKLGSHGKHASHYTTEDDLETTSRLKAFILSKL
jgi:hypothetical protein